MAKTIKRKKTINYLFGDKHKDYIRNCVNNTFNIAEGAVRAGKTVDNVYAFAHEIKTTPDKIHLATGSTSANAKLNIGDANGYGLEYIFRGQSHWGKYKGNECLYIKGPSTNYKQKIVIFAGASKSDSYKKIRGNSYGMWIATEINLHHDNTIKEAFNRQLAAKRRKIFWDLNPDNPNADIYTKYIDLYDKKQKEGTLIGGYNYQHFTIFDNITISEDRKQEIISQYNKESIWYQRDILGKRMVAEGLIYCEFKDYHIIKMQDWNAIDEEGNYTNELRKSLKFITVGVDFGGNISAHSFNATGFTHQFRKFGTLKQKRIPERIDDKELTEQFVSFILELKAEYPKVNIIDIRCDSAEQTLMAGFERALREQGLGIPINNAIKGVILDRIRFYCKMFSTNKYFILESCDDLIMAFKTAIWEEGKNDVRLDDGKQDIDSLDAQEYSTEPYMDTLVQIN